MALVLSSGSGPQMSWVRRVEGPSPFLGSGGVSGKSGMDGDPEMGQRQGTRHPGLSGPSLRSDPTLSHSAIKAGWPLRAPLEFPWGPPGFIRQQWVTGLKRSLNSPTGCAQTPWRLAQLEACPLLTGPAPCSVLMAQTPGPRDRKKAHTRTSSMAKFIYSEIKSETK